MSRTLHLVNASDLHHDDVDRYAPLIVEAVNSQLHQLARAWTDYVWHIVEAVSAQGFKVLLADSDDQVQGALAYHDVLENGDPHAIVLCETILANGGTWVEGNVSVSGAVSHETVELLLDPGANRWANDADGGIWALEGCDAVQDAAYDVDGIAVSDFVFPSYFNPFGQPPFDYLGLIDRPFQILPGGYAINLDAGPVFGDGYEEWRREYGGRVGARSRARETYRHGVGTMRL